jgi:phage FluMu gp28-like protein
MLRRAVPLLPYQERWVKDDSKLKIVVKARQTGFSFAAALRAVLACLERRTTWIFLSKGERQSRLLMEKVQDHVQAIGLAAQLIEKDFMEGATVKQLEVRFPNGSVIYGLPANPETARGFTGNVTLDEFAFHADAEKIYTALFPSITRGFKLEVISTPNGQSGKFFELAKEAGLVPGFARRPGTPWSSHRVTLDEAIAQGLSIDREALRAGLDDQAWAQEYCCEFVSTAAQWIPPELWQMNVSTEASLEPVLTLPGTLYAGWDIARRRDFSVIWLLEQVGDVSWTRGVVTLKNLPTPDQIHEARALMPFIRRLAIDQSGMGLAIFEELQREFPGQVEGVQFTQPVKEALAVRVKQRMENHLLRLPDVEEIRQSFMSLKRLLTATGLVRFDSEHDTKYGHGDHFWACALAEAAAEQPSASLDDGLLLSAERPAEMLPAAMETVF